MGDLTGHAGSPNARLANGLVSEPSSDFSQWVALVSNIRMPGLSTQRAPHRQRRRLVALPRTKQLAMRDQALTGVACRRRPEKYHKPPNHPGAPAPPPA